MRDLQRDSSGKQITKIVVTGGPCAGKTTALSWIQNAFTKMDYAVLFVDETATQLITGGAAPWLTASNRDYQWQLIQLQQAKEKAFTEIGKTLKEEKILVDIHDGIRPETQAMTVDDMYFLWKDIKRGIRGTTMSNYVYFYERYVLNEFGRKRLSEVKKSDVRRFYNSLHDNKSLKISSIDSIHTVMHQVFQTAVEDGIIRSNPTDNMLRELKASHGSDSVRREALTVTQQKIFQDYMFNNPMYRHWYPIFFIMANTGMRVGEAIGLRWQDVDLEKGTINVNHNVVYYSHKSAGINCHYAIHSTKTRAGIRLIPMTKAVKEAFLMEKEYQDLANLHNNMHIDGYTDFIFSNANGGMQNLTTLNKALKRITRDCNDELIAKYGVDNAPALLPPISCHHLRHTFATRLCESGMNIKLAIIDSLIKW